jgi:protein phosphatase 2C-like protein
MGVRTSPPPGSVPWQVIGHTVRGASHVRRETENQDCIRWKSERGRVILALADGHGSAKSFRSAIGSAFAVAVSIEFASELLQAAPVETAGQHEDSRFLSLVKDRLETDIPRRIVHKWSERVDQHLARNPFTEQELAALVEQDGQKSKQLIEKNGRLAYGSTLVTAIAMESFAVFWQIGDGDVLTVSVTGEVIRPVPTDARLIANETTSLCSHDAPRMFRYAILGTPAPMIMLSTDGFANSFLDDEGFFKFGTDVSAIIVAEGLEKVKASLPDWLTEITARGSGDDISLGIICRPSLLTPAAPDPAPAAPATAPATAAATAPATVRLNAPPRTVHPTVVDIPPNHPGAPSKWPAELQRTLVDTGDDPSPAPAGTPSVENFSWWQRISPRRSKLKKDKESAERQARDNARDHAPTIPSPPSGKGDHDKGW